MKKSILFTGIFLLANVGPTGAFHTPPLILRSTRSVTMSPTKFTSALAMVDYTDAALSYFDGIRTPAALIAGSALSTLFSLANEARKNEASLRKNTKLENNVLLAYHILTLLSFLLSLNVVVTATASGNVLMLGELNGKAASLYSFLVREMEYDFIMARWSFYTGMFSFLGSMISRVLIEFNLLNRERIRAAVMSVAGISALFFNLLSFTNRRLISHSNLMAMTVDVWCLFLRDAFETRHVSSIATLISSLISMGAAVALFKRSQQISKPDKKA